MRRFTLFLIILMGVTVGAVAQVSKTTACIPAETQLYLHKIETGKVSKARKEARLFVSCTSDVAANAVAERVKALGGKPQGTVGRYVMVSTPVALVEQIAALDGVTYVSKGPEVSLKTNISRQVTGVDKVQAGTDPLPQAFTGKGVVVGIIDTGFDFTNPVFKDAEGNLRIKAVYCAGITPKEGDAPVVTLDKTELAGVVTTDAEAIIAMQTDDASNSHGTHCAATAAGTHWNGLGGMAPEADIVLCPFSKTDGVAHVDNRAYNIMQSIQYVRDYAKRQGKPFVISMSLNQQDGPHDGTSFMSSMLDQMIAKGSNIVLASSNEGGFDCYVNHQYAANDTLHTIVNGKVQAYAYTRQPGEISLQIGLFNLQTIQEEAWRSTPLRSTDGNLNIEFDFTNGETITKGNIPADVVEDLREKLSELGSSHVELTVERLEDGRTTAKLQSMQVTTKLFVLHIACPEGCVVDLWGDNCTNFARPKTGNYYTKGNSSVSLGDWGTGGSIITVGAWAAKTSFTDINGAEQNGDFNEVLGRYSEFSSYGIDMKDHHHPFISTPGSMIVSAANHFDARYNLQNTTNVVAADENGYTWAAMSGTSMATPTAAGIIALWLQSKPTLTYEEIKEAMAETATTDEWTEADPIHYGHGKLDAYKGLLHVLGITTAIPSLSQHQPKDVTFRLNGNRLTIDGAADGTPVRIYTIDGRLIGSTVISGGSVSLPETATAGLYAIQVGTLGSTLIRK